MSTEERRLAAIVFTDICGFTELMGKNEKAAMALLDQQRTLIRPIIQNFNGEWLKEIGDGILMAFPSAVKAVTCALEIQRILAHNSELTIRIGVHIGDVIKKDGDVFGDGVNIASRLEPLAEPGGICVSERVYEDIRNKPEINSAFQDEQILKGLDRPIKVYSVFTKMGTVPQENPDDPKAKVQKSKIPYVMAGVVIGLLVTIFALKQPGASSVHADKKSLAVFNFENLSSESENDRTGKILQELIITDLSGINDLKIYSSQRLFDIQKQMGAKDSRYIDPSMALDIAQDAGASTMMTGNIIKVGKTTVLTSRLLDVADGSVIKSRKVEGTDIYAMVDQLSSFVIEDLNLGMIETVDLAVSEKTSSNMTAYNHFVTGVAYLNNVSFNEAVVELQEAVTMDPSFKQALYKLAIAQWWASGAEGASSDSATISTLDTYLALSNLDKDEKKVARGVKNIISNKYTDALETFEYLSEIYPDNKEYSYLLGECYFHGLNNPLKALKAFEHAIQLDPEFDLASIHIIDLYISEKMTDKAVKMVERKLTANQNSPMLLQRLMGLKLRQGHSEEGIKISDKILTIEQEHPFARVGKGFALIELSRFTEAEIILIDLRKDYPNKFDVFMLKNGFYFIQGKFLERREKLLNDFIETSLDKKDAFKRQLYARILVLGACLSEDYESLKSDAERFSDINDPDVGGHIDFLYLMAWAHSILGNAESFNNYQNRIQDIIIEKRLTHTWANEYFVGSHIIAAYGEQDWEKVLSTFREYSESQNGQLFREFSRDKKCEAEFYLKKYDLAMVTARKLASPDQDYRTFTFFRPLGYYWQGRIYEEQGKTKEAITSYESLMELWKDGDERIPKRRDTIKRLNGLKKTS